MKQESSNLEKIVSALALLAVGVCFVVWADKVTEWIAIALGVLALVAAAVRAFRFYKTKPNERTTSGLFGIIVVAAVGLLLVTRADLAKDAISFIVGVYIVLSCATQLFIVSGFRKTSGLLLGSYLWPMIGLFVGIFCITGQFVVPDALATVTGIALIIYAVVYLISLGSLQKAEKTYAAKASHKEITEAVIVKEAKTSHKSEHKSEPKSKK